MRAESDMYFIKVYNVLYRLLGKLESIQDIGSFSTGFSTGFNIGE